MFKQTNNVMWYRHRWVLGLILIALLGTALWRVQATRTHFNDAQQSVMTTAQFQKNQDNPKARLDNPSYASYRHERLDAYPHMGLTGASLWQTTYFGPLALTGLMAIFAFMIGMVASGWDHFSQFDRFAFTTGMKRSALFWRRTGLYLLTLLGGHLGYMALVAGGVHLVLPASYVNLSWAQFGVGALFNTVGLAAWFALGNLLGLLAGRLWVLGFAPIIGGILAIRIGQNVDSSLWGFFKGPQKDAYAQFMSPERMQPVTLLVALAVALVALGLAAWSYQHLSLENITAWLTIPALKKPVVLIAGLLAFLAAADPRYGAWQGLVGLAWAGVTLLVGFTLLRWRPRRQLVN